MKSCCLLFLILSILGCSHIQSDKAITPIHLSRCIRIFSEPPGAEIEVDGTYVGETPTILMVQSEKYTRKPIVIVAHPFSSEQNLQRRIIRPPSAIPHEIYFVME